jgi:hypothetical protein
MEPVGAAIRERIVRFDVSQFAMWSPDLLPPEKWPEGPDEGPDLGIRTPPGLRRYGIPTFFVQRGYANIP